VSVIQKKIFCLSLQRTGTTSTGKFLNDAGFKCAGWDVSARNNWTKLCYEGDYEPIFNSGDFCEYNAFEDAPWFYPEFFKVLYHRFPGSKFLLFTRDADKWFDSTLLHSNGKVLGHNQVHTKIYRRELEFYERLGRGEFRDQIEPPNSLEVNQYPMALTEQHRQHYTQLYRLYHMEVKNFFSRNAPSLIYTGTLEDEEKWQKLSAFLGVTTDKDYSVHQNKASEWNRK